MAKILLIVVALALMAADWPRFRGPNGTGISTDTSIPVEFSTTKNLLWKVALDGEGNGSPIIVQGKVFLQSATRAERRLVCLDATTGKQMWVQHRGGITAKTHRKNSLASSTPAADDKCVVAFFWDGADLQLCAFDFNGKSLWDQQLGPFSSQHGAALSPIIHEGRVYLVNDQDERSHVLCFDATTGQKQWSVERPAFQTCYSTPFIRDAKGHVELIVTTTGGITAYNPVDGKKLWDHEWNWSYTHEPLRTVGSSIMTDGLIFAHAGNGAGNSHVIAVRPPSNSESQPTLIWERKKGFPYVPSFIAQGKWIFTVTDRGIAGCYEATTGDEVWTERLGGGVSASPILIGEKVYAISEDGTVYVFKAGPKFELLARNALGETVIATPAVADGRLFIRGKSHLFCFGTTPSKVD